MRLISKAYTLIELVMAIVIAGVVAASLAAVISQGMDAWILVKDQRSLSADGRSALKKMEKELRLTRDNDVSSVITFAANEYEFVDVNGNTIEYRQSGSELLRNNQVLLAGLTVPDGLRFVYLDASGEATSDLDQLKVIQFTLTAAAGASRVSLRSAAGLKNR